MKLINEFSMDIGCFWYRGFEIFSCIFWCFYKNNCVGNQEFTILREMHFQAIIIHEVRLLLSSARNNIMSVASSV